MSIGTLGLFDNAHCGTMTAMGVREGCPMKGNAMTCDQTMLAKLDGLLAEIAEFDDPRRASGQWKQMYKLLQQTDLPAPRVTHVVGMRDVAGATALIDQLKSSEAPAGDAPDPEVCRRALKAFRKRLAVTMLDEESKLGHSPLTKGSDTRNTAAIAPPTEYPAAVWQELVRQGRLKYLGHGLFELGKEGHG